MAVKIFLLGRPGSGKTTAAKYISELAKDLSITVINDYTILKWMSDVDIHHKRFLPTPNNGFDVIDFSVLREALWEMGKLASTSNGSNHLITIEFARADYAEALSTFSPEFLSDSCFFYFNTDVEICLKRIHERVARPCSEGDHPSLSDKDFRRYYGEDNISYIMSNLDKYGISEQRFHVINNECTKEMFQQEIQHYYRNVIKNALYELVYALS